MACSMVRVKEVPRMAAHFRTICSMADMWSILVRTIPATESGIGMSPIPIPLLSVQLLLLLVPLTIALRFFIFAVSSLCLETATAVPTRSGRLTPDSSSPSSSSRMVSFSIIYMYINRYHLQSRRTVTTVHSWI